MFLSYHIRVLSESSVQDCSNANKPLALNMEITSTKISLINLLTTIYFNNHHERQLVDFLKKYPCIIYVKNGPECKFQNCQYLDTEI